MPIPCPCLQSVHLLSVFTSAVSAEASDRYSKCALGSLFRGMSAGSRSTLCPFLEPGSHFVAQDNLDLTASQVLK